MYFFFSLSEGKWSMKQLNSSVLFLLRWWFLRREVNCWSLTARVPVSTGRLARGTFSSLQEASWADRACWQAGDILRKKQVSRFCESFRLLPPLWSCWTNVELAVIMFTGFVPKILYGLWFVHSPRVSPLTASDLRLDTWQHWLGFKKAATHYVTELPLASQYSAASPHFLWKTIMKILGSISQ